ncbi:MAG: BatA and WFA domain-containing protein [Planctomycetota bacterium]|nr:BatA and WFA domain-containing protein [Planctomycetota bacterium]
MNMLSWWQWTVLAAIPPAIIALYFLKLKRHPLEVPSTYLWQRSIEDLHVNSIWQRLRKSLLLLLQLLIVLLAMMALLRPGCRGNKLIGNRFVFLIDNSASMQATDQEPSRLDEAKRRAVRMIDEMRSGDVGMVVSFADTARVEQMFTDNRRRLRRAVEAIEPSERSTSLGEALKVASGLANPGRTSYEETDIQTAEAMPATVYILSDGRFDDVSNFSWGNLKLIYLPIGSEEAANAAILAFSVRRHETRQNKLQAFARIENFGVEEVSLNSILRLDGEVIDAAKVDIGGGEVEGVTFDLGETNSGSLELSINADDDLDVDDKAYAAVNKPRKASVLLVTPGNEPLELALATPLAIELADIDIQSSDFLNKKQYKTNSQSGGYDLVIFDRCRPKEMPQANTYFIGTIPPGDVWKADDKVDVPNIIDVDPSHPIMQWIVMDDVLLHEGRPLVPPPGATTLIDTHAGPMLAVAPREGFEDAVQGFMLIENAGEGDEAGIYARTNWPIRPSFPVFIFNVLDYLGGGQQATAGGGIRPGQAVVIDSPASAAKGSGKKISVRTPSGKQIKLKESRPGRFNFTDTDDQGVYEALYDGKPFLRFAVNLFDSTESEIVPRKAFGAGPTAVEGQSAWEESRKEFWRWLVLAGLVILLFEWYIYNRRVYL